VPEQRSNVSFVTMRRRLLPALLAGLLLAGCGEAATDVTPTAETPAAPVSPAAETGHIAAEGQIVPPVAADLAFQGGGTVAELLVSEGQRVAAGEALIRLEGAAVEAALAGVEAGLAAAEAGLAAAQAQATLAATQRQSAASALAAAEAQLALAQAGPRPEQIAAAERGVAAAEAGVAGAAAERDAALDVSAGQVRAAEAQLAAARSQLTALQETYDTILTTCVELPGGSEVCPLLGPPEESVRAQIAAAEASTSAAQLALTDAQAGATDAERQIAAAGVGVAVAQRDVAAAQLALLNAGARPEQIRLAEIDVAAARLGLTQADVGVEQAAAGVSLAEAGVQRATAGVDEALNTLARLTLSAPFDGTVGDVLVEVGEFVAPGVAVARLAGGAGWVVETSDLVELDVVFVAVGQTAEVALDALPGQTLRGVVSDVGRVPELTRGDVTYRVRIALDDYPDLALRWGMTALVSVDVEGD